MVVLTKIYTRTGDDGTTALGDGSRLPKYDLRVCAYGTVDETNAVIGMVRNALPEDHAELDRSLGRIQNDLFDLGADLCVPDRGQDMAYEPLRVTGEQVVWLESEIDRMNGELKPLTSFILPGGNTAACALHLARTVCRRAERHIIELSAQENEPVSEPVITYMNRLSDLLFVASRFVNDKGSGDRLWQPGRNR